MPAWRTIASSRYVTVVFPFVPVTPTIVIESAGRPNTSAAAGPIAARTDGTSSCGTAASRRRSTSSATAPAAIASRACRCPSSCAPGTQKKSEPAGTSRESRLTSTTVVDDGSPRTSAPAAAATDRSGTGGKDRTTGPEPTRALGAVMGGGARGAAAERPGRARCRDAGSRSGRRPGTAGRPRCRRRPSRARRGSPRRRREDPRRAGTR